MPLRFHPRLINEPFGDPGLFIPIFFEQRAILFDAGDSSALSPKDILKIGHVFISHTHMDHFIGFDRLLRLFLGREKDVFVYGPQGFLKNAEGKLAGYTWNLVGDYHCQLCLHLTEVQPDCLITRKYYCRDKFLAPANIARQSFSGVLHAEAGLRISAVILNHRIPCLGFALQERFHINIIKEKLTSLGLETGPWLTRFKQTLYSQTDPNSTFEAPSADRGQPLQFRLGELAMQIALITAGQKITYITDVLYADSNNQKIVEFAKGSDHLFIEAAFLDKDARLAAEKYHLTARQAGELAARAAVKQFSVFHFSPRYRGQEHLLYREAREAYERLTLNIP